VLFGGVLESPHDHLSCWRLLLAALRRRLAVPDLAAAYASPPAVAAFLFCGRSRPQKFQTASGGLKAEFGIDGHPSAGIPRTLAFGLGGDVFF